MPVSVEDVQDWVEKMKTGNRDDYEHARSQIEKNSIAIAGLLVKAEAAPAKT